MDALREIDRQIELREAQLDELLRLRRLLGPDPGDGPTADPDPTEEDLGDPNPQAPKTRAGRPAAKSRPRPAGNTVYGTVSDRSRAKVDEALAAAAGPLTAAALGEAANVSGETIRRLLLQQPARYTKDGEGLIYLNPGAT